MSQPTAQVSTTINAPVEAVWAGLTNPDDIRKYYMGAIVRTDWTVGSPITWTGEWNGETFEDKGEILRFQPHERMSYSHWSPLTGADDRPENYHVVDIALAPTDSGTEVTLTQSNLEGGVTDADREHRQDYEKNWSSMLAGLKGTVLEGAGEETTSASDE